MDSNVDAREAVWRAIDLTKEGRYAEALPIFVQYIPSLTSNFSDKRLAAASFSFYGLCVAKVERRYRQAVEYCETSLKADRFDANHRANLARIYLEADDRKKAVEALQDGLGVDPGHASLHKIWSSIGKRRPPVLSFLERDNPINIWLGRMLRKGPDADY